ncbi:polymeric immunoglobulin receptor isoform X2 [Siphateles boraxobius]|uniref:polymeric immunoglobulin receptor isoform X2 n=1 Tax=Siphateles boraxobius TaxID=180520 RepID=UPI004064C84F
MNNTSGFTVVSFVIMKTFLFFTLCLIKGHMGEAAVAGTGITGGSMIINCVYITTYEKTRESAKSFCKVSGSECTTMTEVKNDLWIPEERFSMIDDKSLFMISVLVRNLSITDSGTYRCQAGRQTIQTVNFNVKQESCCGRSEDQTAYLGGTAVIHCKYPDTYKDLGKQLFKVQNGSLEPIITALGNSATNGKFSLNVNEQKHVFTVSIADVGRRDAGVYFCGIHTNTLIYTPLLTEIQLHVSDLYIISTVCSCLILLLAVGLSLLLFKCRCKKTEGSVSSDQRNARDGDEEVNSAYYEAIPDSAQESIGLNTVYATTHLPTSPSDSDFYTLAE